MTRYEIYSSRFDISESLYSAFRVNTDEEAIKKLETLKAMESNSWDRMRLIAVVVERQERHIQTLE